MRKRPVLLLDEPFSALDPALRQEMLTLEKLCEEEGTTLLMVSHSVEDAARMRRARARAVWWWLKDASSGTAPPRSC
ncbi:Thiamin ABC transporter, ATPase component / Thiamine transport ATP-binding protein thiQ [Cronobacter sakazakii 701]|nr:Thiamin ABC transporter, ATPase component / Thiamine transport ATP-binding protein thiQ [Cronobacter sakazakii 701]